MFDFSNIYHFFFDLLFTSFSVIILIGACIAMALGLWILKLVKRNLWAAGIAFVPFLVSLIYLCYEKISLTGVMYAIAGADAFLGAVIGFLVSAAILKFRGTVSFEE